MQISKITLAVLLLVLAAPPLTAQDNQEIQWRKLDVNCRRQRRKSRKRYDLPDDGGKVTESSEHIEITTTIRSQLDFELTNLQFEIRILGETAAKRRRDRQPKIVAKKTHKIKKVVPYERLRFEAIKTTLTEKEAKLNLDHGRETRLSGHTYLGYVGSLKDADGNLLLVKTENTKIKRLAEDLGLIPEDVELNRDGVVQRKD